MEINPCKLSVPLKRTGRTWIIEEFYEKDSECLHLYENLSLRFQSQTSYCLATVARPFFAIRIIIF